MSRRRIVSLKAVRSTHQLGFVNFNPERDFLKVLIALVFFLVVDP